ncbi:MULTISPECIES: hypothetical protein [unclassified Leclercia]|uniref:Uncharacterized protein n=1 Tax=Leclercia barmai TaxID=2785629 RepID=A0ABS7RZV6_9ENTR|nr:MULTISPECIES: hypothetical protein [unclassified Leclercia]MBZ0059587.1 hypothetical protein [Leclercia sp. EMC7]MCM5697281.1 hypothetical protein [Leclercia sp. LTM01]MCM5702124.1 hypothetical protein [Leclercia sp. LTM14]
MKIIYPLKKTAVKPGEIPTIDQLTQPREVRRETPQGLRLAAIGAPSNFEGNLYMRQHYDFFDTRPELMDGISRQANAAAAKLGEMKHAAILLMCEAHNEIKSEQRR